MIEGFLTLDVAARVELRQWNKFGSHTGQPGYRDGVQ